MHKVRIVSLIIILSLMVVSVQTSLGPLRHIWPKS